MNKNRFITKKSDIDKASGLPKKDVGPQTFVETSHSNTSISLGMQDLPILETKKMHMKPEKSK